jgi:hypothetical protein
VGKQPSLLVLYELVLHGLSHWRQRDRPVHHRPKIFFSSGHLFGESLHRKHHGLNGELRLGNPEARQFVRLQVRYSKFDHVRHPHQLRHLERSPQLLLPKQDILRGPERDYSIHELGITKHQAENCSDNLGRASHPEYIVEGDLEEQLGTEPPPDDPG